MRKEINKHKKRDPRINYRGEEPSRLDVLTDAVFGIAITLLIFNVNNPNSFSDLITFTKTMPAFLLSVCFLMLIWVEHERFAIIYRLEDNLLIVLNTLFIALVIFYVYPLRFLSVFLTEWVFEKGVSVSLQMDEISLLMIYYGLGVFLLYFVIYLFYARALRIKNRLQLHVFEIFHTRQQFSKCLLMAAVPLLSVLIIYSLGFFLPNKAGSFGAMVYFIYVPVMILWGKQYRRKQKKYPV